MPDLHRQRRQSGGWRSEDTRGYRSTGRGEPPPRRLGGWGAARWFAGRGDAGWAGDRVRGNVTSLTSVCNIRTYLWEILTSGRKTHGVLPRAVWAPPAAETLSTDRGVPALGARRNTDEFRDEAVEPAGQALGDLVRQWVKLGAASAGCVLPGRPTMAASGWAMTLSGASPAARSPGHRTFC